MKIFVTKEEARKELKAQEATFRKELAEKGVKNVFAEFEEFVDNQIKLNLTMDLSRDWEGWPDLFIAKKLVEVF